MSTGPLYLCPPATTYRGIYCFKLQVLQLLYAGRPVLAAALACLSRLCNVHAAAICDALAPRAAAAAVRRLIVILCNPRPAAVSMPSGVGRGGAMGGYGMPPPSSTGMIQVI